LKFTRLGDIIGITAERFFGWTFPTPGPHNRRETYPLEIIGIFADKVAETGAEINPGKAGRFLTGPDGLQGELYAVETSAKVSCRITALGCPYSY